MSNPISSISTAKQARMLQFLNEVKEASEIVALVQQDLEENDRPGNGIGIAVAQRIIDSRNELPANRFRNLEQLDDVPGVGTDKIIDIMKALNKSAAAAFREAMYNGVILNNWELEHHSIAFEREEDFLEVVANHSTLTNFVANQVEQISNEKFSNSKAAELANLLVKKCYVEHFTDAHYASFAFAFWLYQFDADNWFSFDKVRSKTEKYLSYYVQGDSRLELYIYKGFENAGTLVRAITNEDLLVVVNYEEKVVTIWTAELND